MSKQTILDIFFDRGFIEKTTHDRELRDYLAQHKATCYIGFDPTAESLHVGSLIPIMALAHMQRNGHRPIALVGGGTGLVGDPSGKTEMRKLLTRDKVEQNAEGLKRQLSRFIDFAGGKALLLNNADWLCEMGYIPLLRDVGRHFSVNRMIKAESYKSRLDSEEGLSFIEFNYMVLQAVDFMELYKKHDCRIQMGGSDQWGNIVAGVELIRRTLRETAFGITFPLITTASGIKMGKTHKGAVWLDAEKTSPYDYFQFWVNIDDKDVCRFLSLFTFLSMDEIRLVENMEGADLNAAKRVLAFEATRLAHGDNAATSAFQGAMDMFGPLDIPKDLLPSSTIQRHAKSVTGSDIPSKRINPSELAGGIPAFKLFHMAGLTASGGAARRLITQGGAYMNNQRLESADKRVEESDFEDDTLLLRAGKKRYFTFILDSTI